MKSLEVVLDEIVPGLYEHRMADPRGPVYRDMSRSNQCHNLSRDLWEALQARGVPARRELHAYGPIWHYVIAHGETGAAPMPDDEITDLNPWYFRATSWRTGYLHGTREHVMDALRQAGASELSIALHSVETIVAAHTLQVGEPTPDQIYPRAS